MGLLDNIISGFSMTPEERMAANDAAVLQGRNENDAYFAGRQRMREAGERDFTGPEFAKFMAEMTPILGDGIAAKEVWDEATSANPNWPLVLALGGATAIGLIPGAGDAIAKSVKSGARGLLDTAKRVEVDPNAMGSLLGDVRLKPKGDASPSIRAYQGSPHNFAAERLVKYSDGKEEYIAGSPDVLPDVPKGAKVLKDFPLGRMRMDKIGTGEGAQAYGYGLYTAEAEDVAKVYRDQLANSDTAAAKRVLKKYDGDVNKALLDTQKKFDRLEERFNAGDFDADEAFGPFGRNSPKQTYYDQRQIQYNKIMQLEEFVKTGKFPTGSMYKVDIAANPDDFLDWDVPVSQQSAKVQDAWRKFLGTKQAVRANMPRDQFQDPTGRDFLGAYSEAAPHNPNAPFDYQKKFSNVLKRKGIPGIKYLDAGSRGTSDATRNFVVFDENLINIVKKYGVAGAATMLGVTSMDVEQAMAQGSQQSNGLLALQKTEKRDNEEQYRQGLLQ